jgi:hypothetical protein
MDNIFSKIDQAIINAITEYGVLKGTELITKIPNDVLNRAFDGEPEFANSDLFLDRLYKLAQEGKILEVEYVLPDSDRVKSLFFPARTEIRIVGEKT